MTVTVDPPPVPRAKAPGLGTRIARLIARPGFQSWAARNILTRRIARREGAELFDLVQGFVKSHVLYALVELRVLHRLMSGPQTTGALAQGTGITLDRMLRLLQAGAALGLLKRRRGGNFAIARKGAALLGVPGLEQMIRHHDVLYRDMADPVALLRGEVETELAEFWPYVFGAQGAIDPDVTSTYSDLMAQSQGLVAQDTLRAVSLSGVRHLLDIGGGFGAFATAAAAAERGRPVTVYKLGRSDAAAALSVSHTGALAGEDDEADAFFRACGFARVDNFEALIEAEALQRRIGPPGPVRADRIGVITSTGGGAAIVVDQLETRGVTVARPSPAVFRGLAALGLDVAENLIVDLTLAGTRHDLVLGALDVLRSSGEFDLVLFVVGSSARLNPELAVSAIAEAAAAGEQGEEAVAQQTADR